MAGNKSDADGTTAGVKEEEETVVDENEKSSMHPPLISSFDHGR
jgi:hypothetical protein